MTYLTNPINGIKSTLNSSNTYVVGGSTTINEPTFSSGDTTLTVADGTVFDNNTTIKISSVNGTEYLQITNISTNDLTVTRGVFDTTAVDHFTSNTVSGVYIGTEELNSQPDVMVSLKSDVAGTEYFDFSTDGTLWDTFPVSGFTVASNIHEFHTAVKGKRYFRLRFENSGSSKSTSFRANTYYGVFRQGNLPLNQSIGADADSTVVRAIGTGADPNGTYINNPVSGIDDDNSTTTTNTALNDSDGISAVDTTIEVDSSTGFSAGDYFRIGTEIIKIGSVSSTTWSSCTRGQLGTTATTHSDNDPIYRIQVLASTAINDAGNISDSATTITVDSTTDFASSGTIIIEDELITYTGTTSTTFIGCTRGAYETTAASHNDNTVVSATFVGSYTDISQFHGISVLVDGNATAAATGKLQMHFSHDGVKIHRNITVTTTDIASTAPRTLGTVASYFRIIYSNTSSITCSLEAQTMYHMQQVQLVGRLDQAIGSSADVTLVRSVPAGKQPDGDYVNVPADGSGFLTTSNLVGSTTLNQGGTLNAGVTSVTISSDPGYSNNDYIRIDDEYMQITAGAGTTSLTVTRGQLGSDDVSHDDATAVYNTFVSNTPSGSVGDFLDTDGYNTISTFISSDQVSLTNGIVFQFTDDAQASPPSVRGTKTYSFTSDNVTDGQRILAETTLLDGFRLLYTNGATATTDFIIEATLKINAAESKTQLSETLQSDTDVTDVRSVIAGVKKNGLYSNVPIDSDGYIKTNIQKPRTAFGQLSTAEETIQVSEYFPYNINTRRIQSYSLTTNVTGTVYINAIPTITNAGTGYTNGTYTNVSTTTGGSGSGLTLDITVSGGVITAAEVADGGNGSYVNNDTVEPDRGTLGGSGTEAIITLSVGSGTGLTMGYTTNGSGVITNIFPEGTGRGSAWAVDDLIKIGGGNSDAFGRVRSIDGTGATGAVLAISVFDAGTGYTDGTATITQENSMIKLTTNAGTYNKAVARTINTVKYQPGTGLVSRFTAIFATGTANSNQYAGIGDDNDGFFVAYQGTGFGILRRTNGAETFTAQASFSIDILGGAGGSTNPSNLNINFQNGNVFQIRFQWLGFGAIVFSIEDPSNGEFEPFHVIKFANANTTPSAFNPSFPIQYEIENTTNNTALSLQSASCMGAIEGQKTYNNILFSVNITNGATANGALIVRNKTYYQNKINKTNLIIRQVSLANTDATNNAPTKTFTFTLDGTFSTTPTYNDVDDSTSVVEYHNTADTVLTVSGGTTINKVGVPGSDSIVIKFEPGELVIRPNQTLHIVAGGTQYDYEIDVVWIEDQ